MKRSKALEGLYKKCFPWVKSYVFNNSGDMQEAQDLFQDTITVVYHNILEKKFRGDSPLESYIYSISKNLWLIKLRKKKRIINVFDDPSGINNEVHQEINIDLVNYILEQLNEGCRSILRSFYFESETMEEIAKKIGLGSAQAAKTKKLRCMKKLMEHVKSFDLKRDHFVI